MAPSDREACSNGLGGCEGGHTETQGEVVLSSSEDQMFTCERRNVTRIVLTEGNDYDDFSLCQT